MTTAVAEAPKPSPHAMLLDPSTGRQIPAFLGGEPADLPIDSSPADRGDVIVADDPKPAVVAPAAPPEPTVEADAAAVAPAATPEPAKEPATETPSLAAKERPPIPYDRFKEVNTAKKEAQARVVALEAELAAAKAGPATPTAPEQPAFDFAAKETEYIQLALDGRAAEAVALRAEIDATRMAAMRAELTKDVSRTTSTTLTAEQTKAQIDSLAEKYAEQYPALDGEHAEFNELAVADFEAFYIGYMQGGTPPIAAFERAVKTAAKLHGLDTPPVAEPVKEPVTPKRDVTPKAAPLAQPPPTTAGSGGASAGATQRSVAEMTDAEMDALPAATLARLRGDFL